MNIIPGRLESFSQRVVDTMGDEYTLKSDQMIVRCMHAGKSFMFTVMYSIIQGATLFPNGFWVSKERYMNTNNPFPITHGKYTHGKLEKGCFIEFVCPNNNTAVIIVTKTSNKRCPNYIRAFIWKAKEMADKFNQWQQMGRRLGYGRKRENDVNRNKRQKTHHNTTKKRKRLRL